MCSEDGEFWYDNFDVLLTVHLSIILAINQLNAQIFFYNKFIIRLYMFRALCAHHQSALNLCTGRPPTGVMIPDAV